MKPIRWLLCKLDKHVVAHDSQIGVALHKWRCIHCGAEFWGCEGQQGLLHWSTDMEMFIQGRKNLPLYDQIVKRALSRKDGE